jgi:hypothetical protein
MGVASLVFGGACRYSEQRALSAQGASLQRQGAVHVQRDSDGVMVRKFARGA